MPDAIKAVTFKQAAIAAIILVGLGLLVFRDGTLHNLALFAAVLVLALGIINQASYG